ncbi:hypothetical protein CsatB_013614 [Cannabis sativa]|uniref:TsaA-like domain-containing protein n=2 Tax=Cannabis sativa TaxID=3483 RepID=A0A7J6DQX3_CANSA|nr:uncharacterized protein LOC115694704 [Cannabis sativa]KAF4348511.1 hypothetical protein G4B88_012083 [Cannabis sativa]KAF4359709.1 hypothetical protein F8388_008271 [Cannabis sativa]KAF4383889.1 hypothetical protein G4B88_016322 [Cannabis sativa]
MAMASDSNGVSAYLALAMAALFASTTAFSVIQWKKKSKLLETKIRGLQKSLNASMENCAGERQGRIRAQQALRKTLSNQPKLENSDQLTSYPMTPIGTIQSCFSTRNGTPRQPLLVPLARACLVFDSSIVPPASLVGLGGYSHCWIIYVFHLNTNMEKLWKHPSKARFKAKVRVPRLKGGKMGVFATRSPHRPCPIGLTVAKIEAVQEHMMLLSGADLVDGTPVLDVKPYLPFCDSVQNTSIPEWLMGENLLVASSVSFAECFNSTLSDCWEKVGENSLYASPDEFQNLIRQVLSWDIRSLAQRNRPHNAIMRTENGESLDSPSDSEDHNDDTAHNHGIEQAPLSSEDVLYFLILEGFKISYRIDTNGNVTVEKVSLSRAISKSNQNRSNYLTWRDKLS